MDVNDFLSDVLGDDRPPVKDSANLQLELVYGKDADTQKWYTDDRGRRWYVFSSAPFTTQLTRAHSVAHRYQKGQIMELRVSKLKGTWAEEELSSVRMRLMFESSEEEALGTEVEILTAWDIMTYGKTASCKLKISGSSINSRHNRKFATFMTFESGAERTRSFTFYITSNRTSYSRQHGVDPAARSLVAASKQGRHAIPKPSVTPNAMHTLFMEALVSCMHLDATRSADVKTRRVESQNDAIEENVVLSNLFCAEDTSDHGCAVDDVFVRVLRLMSRIRHKKCRVRKIRTHCRALRTYATKMRSFISQ